MRQKTTTKTFPAGRADREAIVQRNTNASCKSFRGKLVQIQLMDDGSTVNFIVAFYCLCANITYFVNVMQNLIRLLDFYLDSNVCSGKHLETWR